MNVKRESSDTYVHIYMHMRDAASHERTTTIHKHSSCAYLAPRVCGYGEFPEVLKRVMSVPPPENEHAVVVDHCGVPKAALGALSTPRRYLPPRRGLKV